jgi:hypothetical protein
MAADLELRHVTMQFGSLTAVSDVHHVENGDRSDGSEQLRERVVEVLG